MAIYYPKCVCKRKVSRAFKILHVQWQCRDYSGDRFYCFLLYEPRQANLCLRASVMTNFNCACPAIQRGQGYGFLSEGSSWFTVCMSEQRRFWRDCADAQAARTHRLAWTFTARIGDKYQIRLTRSIWQVWWGHFYMEMFPWWWNLGP